MDSLAEDKSFSVPVFLRTGKESGHDHKLVVIAIHAILLESGFVGFDLNMNLLTNRLCCPDVWSSSMFQLSLHYTLPEIGTADMVVVKFQSIGKFISIYGSWGCGSRGNVVTRMVRFNEEQLVPFFNVVWANCGVKESIKGQDGFEGIFAEKEGFRFWRTVKDNFALPLLIDICENAGLGLPPCFMRLPTDLKLKIFKLLSGVEIAKVGSTCSEIRNLASSDELWKVKFDEEFGKDAKKGEVSWKTAFVKHWNMRPYRRVFGIMVERRRGFEYGRPLIAPVWVAKFLR